MNWDDSLRFTSAIICIWGHAEMSKLSLSLRTERKEMKMFIESNFCMEWSNSGMVWGEVTSSNWSEVTFGGGKMTGGEMTGHPAYRNFKGLIINLKYRQSSSIRNNSICYHWT